ncbi:MAG: trigger factor [Chloroflexota bacterium]
MKVTQEPADEQQVVLHVEVDEDHLEEHMNRAYRSLVQKVNIPGFRKGKAPRRIVENMIGREHLLEEAMESLVPDAVSKAIEQESVQAYGAPSVNVTEREPLPKLDVTVPLEPTVDLADYRSIGVSAEPEEVTDEQVEEAIERMRQSQATWEPVERPVQHGDRAVIAAEGKADGQTIISTGEDTAEYLVEEGSTNPLPGFADELVGMSAGQEKDFTLSAPDDHQSEEIAGKDVEFHVRVDEVKEQVLPELDDDLARSAGEGYETLDELRQGLREQYEQSAREQAESQLRDQALDQVIERSEFHISPLLIEHEAEHVLEDQQQALQRYQISVQDYMRSVGKSGQEMLAEARDSATTRLKRTLVVDRLVEEEGIDVSDEEIEQEIENYISSYGEQGQEVDRSQFDTDETRQSIQNMLKRRKAVDRLVELVKANPAETPQRETADDTEAAVEPSEDSGQEAAATEGGSVEERES